MSYSGRSPFKDVVRSVVLGAAMISPAVLAACANSPTPPVNPEPLTVNLPDAGNGAVASNVPDVAIADSGTPAPPDSAVRPRTPVGTPQQFPTRGFSGAARVRA